MQDEWDGSGVDGGDPWTKANQLSWSPRSEPLAIDHYLEALFGFPVEWKRAAGFLLPFDREEVDGRSFRKNDLPGTLGLR